MLFENERVYFPRPSSPHGTSAWAAACGFAGHEKGGGEEQVGQAEKIHDEVKDGAHLVLAKQPTTGHHHDRYLLVWTGMPREADCKTVSRCTGHKRKNKKTAKNGGFCIYVALKLRVSFVNRHFFEVLDRFKHKIQVFNT